MGLCLIGDCFCTQTLLFLASHTRGIFVCKNKEIIYHSLNLRQLLQIDYFAGYNCIKISMQIADACLTDLIQRSIAATDVHVQQ